MVFLLFDLFSIARIGKSFDKFRICKLKTSKIIFVNIIKISNSSFQIKLFFNLICTVLNSHSINFTALIQNHEVESSQCEVST